MKRAYRLRRPDQFRRVRREGRTVTTPLLTLAVHSGRRRRIRCGFVVGKPIGGAVQRNRAKRRVREAVRLALPMIETGYDLVFIVRSPKLSTLAFTEVCALVEQVLRRAQLWRIPPAQTAVAAIETPIDGSMPPTER